MILNNSKEKRWPFLTVIAMLLIAWGCLHMLPSSELVPNKKPFAAFPLSIAHRWEGQEVGLEPEILDILKLSDYMMRVYVAESKFGHTPAAPVWLYVGYYQSQRTGITYHSPKNCLPGSGWQILKSDEVTVRLPQGASANINKVLVQKGMDRQVILYWYHDRGRIIAGEYWAKAYMMWDAITQHRTDGALVRISVPVTTTAEDAYELGHAFLMDVSPLLWEYMPPGIQAL
jgi:EpsI family protein